MKAPAVLLFLLFSICFSSPTRAQAYISTISNIDFGQFYLQNASLQGTISITPAGGVTRSNVIDDGTFQISPCVIIMNKNNNNQQTISFTFPSSILISNGSHTMLMDSFSWNATGSAVRSTSTNSITVRRGTIEFRVGARLTILTSASDGTYQNTSAPIVNFLSNVL